MDRAPAVEAVPATNAQSSAGVGSPMCGRPLVLPGLLALSSALLVGYSALGYPTIFWACAATISAGVALAAIVVAVRAGRQRSGAVFGRARCLHIAFALLALSLIAIQILAQPLPEPIVGRIILACDGWILTRYDVKADESPAPIDGPFHQFLTTYLEHSLVAHFRQKHRVPAGVDDVSRIIAYLSSLKLRLLTTSAVTHPARSWPVVLSGVGWCDQVNRIAALMFAREFPISQTFNVYCAEPYAGHSIGRVWSNQARGWLYYDVWGDEVVVYRLNPACEVEYLARRHPAPGHFDTDEIDRTLKRLYAATARGWIMNDYRPTFGAYLLRKAWWKVSGQSPSAPAPVDALKALAKFWKRDPNLPPRAPYREVPATALDAQARREFSRAYLRARLEHLLGDSSRAAVLYARAAARPVDPRDELLGTLRRAALVFSELIAELPGPSLTSG